uniref:DDE Tnp4 domain-containing protein n=1 Tax=Glossina brevipalpis TaxID=37001 RepID=A0A1A9W9P0_9MUSC
MKRSLDSKPPEQKLFKHPQRSISSSDILTKNLQRPQTVSRAGTRVMITSIPMKTQPLEVGSNVYTNTTTKLTTSANAQAKRPTVYIKREAPRQRTICTVTLELIEKNPYIYLGIDPTRLNVLKNVICPTANVNLVECYLTLKKLRQNEEFSILAGYFEISEIVVQQIFARTIVKLATYLRFLIRWSDSKKYDRHKTLPFAFRDNLSNVQSLVECVETDILPSSLQIDCSSYKYIVTVNMNGIISFISEAYVGHYDDLFIFSNSNFKNAIPNYLSLVADPGKSIRRMRTPKATSMEYPSTSEATNVAETDSTTDSAEESANELDKNDKAHVMKKYRACRIVGELASQQTLTTTNNELTSKQVKNFSIPTVRIRESVCRVQIGQMVNSLREFKVLQPLAIKETILYQYLNEILIVCAALNNLQK